MKDFSKHKKIIQKSNENSLICKLPIVFAIFVILFAICYCFNMITNADVITLIVFASFVITVFILDEFFWIKYIYATFMMYSLLGVYVDENTNIYLTELACYSGHNGSFFLYTVTYFVFYYALWAFDVYQRSKTKYQIEAAEQIIINKTNIEDKICLFLGYFELILIAILFIKVLKNPAFVSGYGRFYYNEEFLSGIFSIIYKIVKLLSPVIFILYLKDHKKLCFGILILEILFYFWTGNKFGAYFDLIAMAAPIIICELKRKKINMIKLLQIGLICVIILCGTVFLHNSLTYGKSFDDNLEYLQQRTAQQGELWWAIYGQEKNAGMHISELSDEYNTFFTLNDDVINQYNYGIYKIMRKTTPAYVFYNRVYYGDGSRYSMSGFASVYYYFKTGGLIIFAVISAILYGFVINLYYHSLLSKKVIESILYYKIGANIYTALTMADFYLLFSFKMLILVGILIIYKLLLRSGQNSKSSTANVVKNHKSKRIIRIKN